MDNIPSFILNPEFTGILFYIRIIFIIISTILFSSIVFFLLKTSWLKHRMVENLTEFITYKPLGKGRLAKEWGKIESRLDSGKEAEYKMAIIEADNILDEVLERMGYKGDSITDRLKQINSSVLENIDKVWEAHRVRNNVVHDPDFKVTKDKTEEVLGVYKKSLENLEAF